MYLAWKWSNGDSYYKSARRVSTEIPDNVGYNSQQNAINQSLNDDNFFNQDNDILFTANQTFGESKREDLDLKMADREMIVQRGVNPFLQTSYVNDVVTRDIFLKPLNTTFERIKAPEK